MFCFVISVSRSIFRAEAFELISLQGYYEISFTGKLEAKIQNGDNCQSSQFVANNVMPC